MPQRRPATGGGAGTRQKYRTTYIMLPIMYVGNFTETLSFHIGPQVSLLTKAVLNSDDLALSENGFNTFDFGGVGGLEARVGPARVGARYNLSLGKIFGDGATATSPVDAYYLFGVVQKRRSYGPPFCFSCSGNATLFALLPLAIHCLVVVQMRVIELFKLITTSEKSAFAVR